MTTKRVVVNLTEQEAEVCQAMAQQVRDVPLTVSRDFDRGYLVLELEVPEHWTHKDINDFQAFCFTVVHTVRYMNHGSAL